MRREMQVPEVGERGRTFGGEFEVVAQDRGNIVIRWVDDGSVAEFDASVFRLVLESYSRAVSGDDDLDGLRVPAGLPSPDILGTLEEEAADEPCPLCATAFDAARSCQSCGSLECPTCGACECVLLPSVDSAGRLTGRM